jgi:hypothetical protein
MAIADSSVNTDVWNEVRTLIVASAPYITNSTTAATTAASINAAYNDKSQTKPQVVIYPITKDEDINKFGSNYGKVLINVQVECYAGNSLGVDQLCDQVETSLRATNIPGISLVAVGSDISFVNPNEAKFHVKSLTFTYDRE